MNEPYCILLQTVSWLVWNDAELLPVALRQVHQHRSTRRERSTGHQRRTPCGKPRCHEAHHGLQQVHAAKEHKQAAAHKQRKRSRCRRDRFDRFLACERILLVHEVQRSVGNVPPVRYD